jgi:hypothetical protein
MNTRRRQIYLAHSCNPEDLCQEQTDADDAAGEMEAEDAAEYISALLSSLRVIAVKAQLPMLSDLLYVAEEEAKLHCRA